MKRRTLLVAAMVGLFAPLGAAAIALGPEEEMLVEGHSVLAVLQPRGQNPNASFFAAAVAVLVEEREERSAFRYPGVLWFNDQYLVNPSEGGAAVKRWPKCAGTVYAVPRAAGNPVDAFHAAPTPSNPLQGPPQYNESYYLTDPLDQRWIVHRWLVNSTMPGSSVVPVWTVQIMNGVTAGVPREAADACAQETRNCVGADEWRTVPPGDLTASECTMNGRTQSDFRYNALLLIPLDLLTPTGYKDHSLPDGADLNDSAIEGNSHAFNPFSPLTENASVPSLPPIQYRETDVLRFPHGGSSDECLPATLEWRCHASYDMDIFWDERPVAPATAPNFNQTWFDVVGSTAPFLCEGNCPNS